MTGRALALYRSSLPAVASRPPASAPVLSGAGGVAVYWTPEAFGGPLRGMIAPNGTTIAAIVARALAVDPALDRDFEKSGTVLINGREVPRCYWAYVRARRRGDRRIAVTLHPYIGRGGGNTLATVIQIAALVAAIAIAGPFGGAAALGLTPVQASLVALGLTVGGSLAAGALSHPPTLPQLGFSGAGNGASAQLGRAGISGNALSPGAPVPHPTGARRYAPPFACNPYAYLDGDDEIIEFICALSGPASMDAIRLGNASLDDMPDAEVQISEGKPGDAPLTLIDRVTASDGVGIDVSRHQVDADNGDRLDDQAQPEQSLPIVHPMIGGVDADEIVVTLECAGGLVDLTDVTRVLSVPVRLQLRRRGDTGWRNVPEVHFTSSDNRPFRKTVTFKWEAPPIFISQAPTANGPTLAFKTVPGQTVEPPRAGWQADSYFSAGSGADVMSASTFNAHFVRNLSLEQNGVIVHLDPAEFPSGAYEIRIIFGATYNASTFTASSYTIGGIVYDLFGYYNSAGIYKIPRSRSQLRDEFTVPRCASIWHRNPLPEPEGIAFVAARIRNRQLGELTVSAAGLVPQWDGAEWSGLAATRNPAPHFRQRLAQAQPAELIDDAPIVDWIAFNAAMGYETAAVLLDGSISDGLNLIASAGRGRLRQSEIFGVMVDRDTSAEGTVQTFSLRNCRDFGMVAPMAERTGGLRVRFADVTRDHKENYVIVRNPNAADPSLPLEERVDETHDIEELAVKRALFDLLGYEERANQFGFDVPVLGLRATRGDKIAVQHDILAPFGGGARIRSILTSGGLVTGLTLDGTVPTPADQAFIDIAAAWSNYDLAFAAGRLGVSIRLRGRGGELKAEIVASGDESSTVTFVTPFAAPDGLEVGCHVVSGPLDEESRPMKIQSIVPKGNYEFTLVCVDEANAIHANG